MTIADALYQGKTQIAPISDSAGADAQRLLCAVLGCERAWLLAHRDQHLTPDQRTAYEAWVARAAMGEPLPYILGRQAFYDRDFWVTPAVLIPRPETELLLEQALAYAAGCPLMVADIGTGSGALAVTFAALQPQTRVYATDISPDALAVARANATQHHADITFFEGDLAQPLLDHAVHCDLIMANLPYIAAAEVPTLQVSHYEPLLALDGGADGLVLVRRLLAQLPTVMNDAALILLEIGAGQGQATLAIAQHAFPAWDVTLLPDYAGHDRIIRILKIGAV